MCVWLLDMMIIINILKGINVNDITLLPPGDNNNNNEERDILVCSTGQVSTCILYLTYSYLNYFLVVYIFISIAIITFAV